MFKQLTRFSILLFSFAWAVFLFLDYMDKHPNHIEAFQYFKYFNLLLVMQVVGLTVFVIVQFINVDRIKRKFYTGTTFLCFLAFICVSILYSFDVHVGEETTIAGTLYFLSRLFSYFLVIIVIFSSAFVMGQEVLKRFFDKGNSLSLSLATGSMILVILMMCLAAIHQLKQIPLAILIVLPILVLYKRSISFYKSVLFSPFKDYQNISYWGYLLYFVIIVGLGVNLISVLSPYPYGFDARNYYINLTQLISENYGLVEGFQPYNWQLLMSSGFVLFNSHEISILLSFSSFILAMIALNEFARKIFKIKINYRLLCICVLIVTPAIFNQLSIDVKIDFALLFFQIVLVHQFFKYVNEDNPKLSYLILLGLLSGFALGIKFTQLYLIATMVITYWTIKSGRLGLLASSVISIGVFLLAKIDDVGGLRSAHLGVNFQQWFLLGIGLVTLIYFFITKRNLLIKVIKFSLLFAFFTSIPIFPWAIKNYSDTKSLSPKTLLLGKAPGFKTTFRELDFNFKQKRNN